MGYGGLDGTRQKFTQKERDSESLLDFSGARYYSPASGRFTSTDPLLSSGEEHNPQSWNRYQYGLNNPFKYVDPFGLATHYYIDNREVSQKEWLEYYGRGGWDRVTVSVNGVTALDINRADFCTPYPVSNPTDGVVRIGTTFNYKAFRAAINAGYKVLLGLGRSGPGGGEGIFGGGGDFFGAGASDTWGNGPLQGGPFRQVQQKGMHAHHTPAWDAIRGTQVGLTRDEAPAIAMEPQDHRRTSSFGSSNEAKRYRQKQRELIQQGRFREAMQMDIDDVRSRFGTKYDDAIDAMLRYYDRR
jgi:RHS repeat-associated protein